MTTVAPEELRPGDRVRVTFDADVVEQGPRGVRLGIKGGKWSLGTSELGAVTFERLPPEWKVGDRAMWSGDPGEIIAIHGGHVWFKLDLYPSQVIELSKLYPIPESYRP